MARSLTAHHTPCKAWSIDGLPLVHSAPVAHTGAGAPEGLRLQFERGVVGVRGRDPSLPPLSARRGLRCRVDPHRRAVAMHKAVDMRPAAERLSAHVMHADAHRGYIFVNARATRIKMLMPDASLRPLLFLSPLPSSLPERMPGRAGRTSSSRRSGYNAAHSAKNRSSTVLEYRVGLAVGDRGNVDSGASAWVWLIDELPNVR